jgi:hypothetical protein
MISENTIGVLIYHRHKLLDLKLSQLLIKYYVRKMHGEWRYSSSIHHFGTRWRWVVSFTSLPLYFRAEEPTVPIGCEAGWASEPVWTLWSRGKSLGLIGNRTAIPRPSARSPSGIPILKWISKKYNMLSGFSWLRLVNFLLTRQETSGFKKGGEFVQLSDCRLIKDSAPWSYGFFPRFRFLFLLCVF